MKKLILTVGFIVALSQLSYAHFVYGAKTYKGKTPDNTVHSKKDVVVEVKETDITETKNHKYGMVLREIVSAQKDIDKMNADIARRQAQLDAWIVLRDAMQAAVDSVVLKVEE